MLISILIPVYNAEKYLKRTINSVLKQDYPKLEVVLFDDASKDNSREIMFYYSKRYPNKVFSYYTDKNGGIGASKNAALSHSKGDYVFFMDCDDYFLEKNYISDMVSNINDNIDIVLSGFRNVDYSGKINYTKKFRNNREAFFQSIPLFAKLYRKKFLENNFIKSPSGVILEDVLYQSLLQACNPICAVSNIPGYCWVQNPSSASHAKLKSFSDDSFENAKKYFRTFEEKAPRIKNKNDYIQGIFLYFCWHMLKLGVDSNKNEIIQEYKKIVSFLETYPEFKQGRFFTKGSKFIVRIVMRIMYFLYKLKLLDTFFKIYSKFGPFFKKLWPNL